MNEKKLIPHLFVSESVGIFEDILRSGLSLRLQATGKSMTPFLTGGEILTIKKVPAASLRIGDLIFFKTHEGFPLIHRIVKRQQEEHGSLFHTKGDAVLGMDNMISEINVLGKVCRVEQVRRDGEAREIDMESHPQRFINYMTAMFSLAKTRLYCAAARILPLFLRKALKKVFI
jgi:signal peptidase I